MSRPRLKISSFVVERLSRIQEFLTGQLFGTYFDNTLLIVGYNTSAQKKIPGEESDIKSDSENFVNYDIVPNLPAEVDLCGAFVTSAGEKEPEKNAWLKEVLEFDVTDNPVFLKVDLTYQKIEAKFYISNKLEDATYDIVEENELAQWFVYIRLTARIPFSCDFQLPCVQESFSFLRKKILSGNAAFQLNNSKVYILGGDVESISGASPDSSVGDLFLDKKGVKEEVASSKNKSKSNLKDIDVISASMYMKCSNNDSAPQPSPAIKYVKKDFQCAEINLSIDSLSMVKKETKISQLHGILTESVCRSLKLNEMCLLPQLKSMDINDISLPQTYHFLPQSCGHFISIAYPVKSDTEELKSLRETFHILLSLPMDRPILRRENAFNFSQIKRTSTALINPHVGLSPSGVKDGEVSLVQGFYAYYHYKQDNFDDSGWGCAYRSLQTLFSWFRMQGYTNKPVPTHKEIQQCLVDIGDKPPLFVDSNTWIGSTEVSFVLDTLLGVSSRIVNVSSGDELSMKGGELSFHFKTQGTPVMIGGGVLAHTILGVDFNRRTGALKFLILDPHYTGTEDLNVIQGKGWCGWKGMDFWKKDSFYNMCLPIRPKCI